MFQDSIKIHDKYQFEIKLGYLCKDKKDMTLFDLETYFFLPNSLSINKHTYSKNEFYNDINSNVRFKTPIVGLKDVKRKPLSDVHKALDNLKQEQTEEAILRYQHKAKMFCCILRSSLRDNERIFFELKKKKEREESLRTFLKCVHELGTEIKKLRDRTMVIELPENLEYTSQFCDEYASLILEKDSFDLGNNIGKEFSKYKIRLMNVVRSQNNYRLNRGYESIVSEENDNEKFIYRTGVLKKYMGEILFLDTNAKKVGKLTEQIIFGVAAALSMAFATSIAFATQLKFGTLSSAFFAALVISYIFKDRIKEIAKEYLKGKIMKKFFDYEMDIIVNPKVKIGSYRESFSFLKEKNLPEKIKTIRDRDHLTEIENFYKGEQVFVYKRYVRLFSKKFKTLYGGLAMNGVNDILRFNVSKFLNKMDNPDRKVAYVGKKRIKKVKANKVYHLNLVIKYVSLGIPSFRRFRIILDRNGIKRIEKIFSDKENRLVTAELD